MKRRKFLKGLVLVPAVLATDITLPAIEPVKKSIGGQIKYVVIDNKVFHIKNHAEAVQVFGAGSQISKVVSKIITNPSQHP